MNRTVLDLWVGFFVAIGLAALLFLALKVGNLSTANFNGQTYLVKAKFDNIGGLKARAPVKSAGVVVGRVALIDFDSESYQAIVTLKLNSHYRFPTDTFATILTSGLLGEQYIALQAGGDTDVWKEGAWIQKTQSALVLESLIGQFFYNQAAAPHGADKTNGTDKK